MTETLKGFGTQNREIFLEHIRNGMMRGAAAEALGLSRRKVREWINTHPAFEAAVLDAEVDAMEHVKEAVYQAAVNGSVSAAKTWFEINGMAAQAEQKGPVSSPAPRGGDPFSDLDNVSPLDLQRRRRGS